MMKKRIRCMYHFCIGLFYRSRAALRKFFIMRKILRRTRKHKALTILEIQDAISSTFRNAIDLLSLGVEDFIVAEHDSRRYLTAVRNVYSGLVLMFKAHLMDLTKADDCRAVFPNGISCGLNQKTADISEILVRFKQLGIGLNCQRFGIIRKYRNDIEHLFDRNTAKGAVAREYVVDMILMAKVFMSDYMQLDPLDELPQEVWAAFLREERVVEDERRRVEAALDAHDWVSDRARRLFGTYSCEKCGSMMWIPDDDGRKGDSALDCSFKCRGCGDVKSYENIMFSLTDNLFVGTGFGWCDVMDDCSAFSGLGECPECSAVSFDCEDGVCFVCGHRENPPECNLCGEKISPDEMLCWNEHHLCCHCQNLMDKDD